MQRKFAIVRLAAPAERREAEAEARVRLIRGRRALGLSQLALSQKLSISRDAVEDYEAARSRVPGWVLVAIERLVSAARKEAA